MKSQTLVEAAGGIGLADIQAEAKPAACGFGDQAADEALADALAPGGFADANGQVKRLIVEVKLLRLYREMARPGGTDGDAVSLGDQAEVGGRRQPIR